jgi:hypothetical protein
MRRKLSQYQGCTPEGVSGGSEAHMRFFVADAKADIAELVSALTDCQRALANLVAPDAIRQTTVINAFAQVTAAETKARNLLQEFAS